MDFNSVMANLGVSDLDRARRWYAGLIGRGPDAVPMDATYSKVLQLADPDGNRVVLTAPFARN